MRPKLYKSLWPLSAAYLTLWVAGMSHAVAEDFPIVPPTLQPRAAGGYTQPVASTPTYGGATASSSGSYNNGTYGSGTYNSGGSQGGGTSYGAPGAYGGQPSTAYTAPPPISYGGSAYGTSTLPPATLVQPERAPEGICRVQISPDRQTLELVSGPQALAREHVPLGDYRAQSVVHSPDGRWAVAYSKLRGAKEYAALVLNLERCGLQHTYELSAAGSEVSFDGDNAVLRYAGGQKRIDLRAGSVQ